MHDWEQFLVLQEQEFGKETVDRWLRSLKITGFDACNLYIEAKDSFQVLWFDEHIRHKLLHFVNRNHSSIQVHLQIAGTKNVKNLKKKTAAKTVSTPSLIRFDELDPSCTFEEFILTKENSLAGKVFDEMCMTLVASKREAMSSFSSHTTQFVQPFNPIYLYGPPGSGKSHLLMAVTHKLRRVGYNAIYARAELFCDHVVKSIRAQEMAHFRNTYRTADILLIDDVHQLAKKSATQEEFFHTFNALHIAGKQIVLSANVPPLALTDIEARLVSRFEWGIVLQLASLERKELVEMIEKKAKSLHYPLSTRSAEFLAETFATSPKSAARALDALILRSHLSQKNKKVILPVASVKSMLNDLIEKEKKESLSFDRVIAAVSEHYGVPQEELCGKSQSRECVLPRQVAMYLCRQLLKMPFMQIGDHFSRDHSTVMSACRQVQKQLAILDSDLALSCNAITHKLHQRYGS